MIQAALLVAIGISFLADRPELLNPGALILIFAGWQLLSLIIHAAAGPQPWKMKTMRKYHLYGVALVLLLLLVAMIQSGSGNSGDKDDKYSMEGLGTLIYTLVPVILLSLFYVWITFAEWRKSRQQA